MQKVVVIEDQTILRDLICRLLENYPMFELVAATGDGQAGLDICLKNRPDFVILDIMLPGLHGLDILDRLKKENPRLKVLLFSSHHSSAMVKRVVELGVDGYIEKNAGVEELEKAIVKVSEGQRYFGPMIVEKMRELMLNSGEDDSLETLSTREREILKLIAESFTSKEIADRLYISPRTVDTHRVNIMKKLNLNDIAGMTRYAISHGLIEVPDEK